MEKEQGRRAIGAGPDPDHGLHLRRLALAEPQSERSDRRALEQYAVGQRLSGQLAELEHEFGREQQVAALVEEIIVDGKVRSLQEPAPDPDHFGVKPILQVNEGILCHLSLFIRREAAGATPRFLRPPPVMTLNANGRARRAYAVSAY